MDAADVTSRASFLRLLTPLHAEHRGAPDAWEIATPERDLEALAACAADATLGDEPAWRTPAELVGAATAYE